MLLRMMKILNNSLKKLRIIKTTLMNDYQNSL